MVLKATEGIRKKALVDGLRPHSDSLSHTAPYNEMVRRYAREVRAEHAQPWGVDECVRTVPCVSSISDGCGECGRRVWMTVYVHSSVQGCGAHMSQHHLHKSLIRLIMGELPSHSYINPSPDRKAWGNAKQRRTFL
jgi:hypothetical protein